MGRNKDNSPVGQTCPIIDDVISMAHAWYSGSEVVSKSEYQDFEKKMEKIRSANSTLREWGNEQYYNSDSLESDLDDANKEISNLQSEIEYLRKQISKLENQVA